MKHTTIRVDTIHPNPHRDLNRNPIPQDQVEKVLASISRTGFWDNVVVRKHPERPGEYQLAYGHTRLEAVKRAGIKEITLPVGDLSDWDMFCEMVDENDSQRSTTPAIVFENIEAGLRLLENAFNTIGKDGTEEDFWKVLGSCAVQRCTAQKSNKDQSFITIRNAFFRREGIGRKFLVHILPGNIHPNVISSVLASHYGQQREAAKAAEAEAAEQEAEAAEQEAEEKTTEGDQEGAEKAHKEAEEARRKAAKLREEAKKIGGKTIDSKILLQFEKPQQMVAFSEAISASHIPKSHHKKAADYALKEELSVRNMSEKLDQWWYEKSGKKARDLQNAAKEQAFKIFKRHVREGDFKEFLVGITNQVKTLTHDLDIALKGEVATFYDNEKHKTAVLDIITKMEDRLATFKKQLKKKETPIKVIGEPESNGAPAVEAPPVRLLD